MKTDYAGIRIATALEGLPTLRDQFAMAALTAIVSNHMSGMEQPKWDSSLAYEYADAMMEARDAKR